MKICRNCKKLFKTDEQLKSVKCNSGLFLSQFHISCSDLNEHELDRLKSFRHIKWICDYCLDMPPKNTIKSEPQEIIPENVLKQFEMQNQLLIDIQNRLNRLEIERSCKNESIKWKGNN